MKKLTAVVMALFLALGMPGTTAFADTTEVNVYVTIANENGELALAQEEIRVYDVDADGAITINDALYAAHEAKYEGGAAAGYASYEGEFGISLSMLWGAGNGSSYGYYVNNASAWSLTDPVAEGDYVNAYVFTDLVAWSDTYSFFDVNTVEAEESEEIALKLSYAGYDADWNPVTLPVEGAVITVNGEATEFTTDTEGNVKVTIDVAGEYVISAESDAMTLVPPVCKVTVSEAKATTDKAQSFIQDIITYQMAGASTIQEWIDGSLIENAGQSSEWYVIGLSQYGEYDFSAYETSLINYLAENEEKSASSRQKYALALLAVGSDDEYISQTLNDSIGEQGIMSLVYGLHLLNNGCVSDNYTAASVIQELLVLQFPDGGWAIMGENGNVDVTAMTIQALAPHYEENQEVKEAIDKALIFLSEYQLETGDYSSYGVPNPESTSQVIAALSSLGIDCQTDERFIKNGNTLIDSLGKYCLDNGVFSHKEGEGYNAASTVQVFYSLVAYVRMAEGKSPLYIFDGVSEGENSEQEPEPTPGQNQESSEVTPESEQEQSSGAMSGQGYTPTGTSDPDENGDSIPGAEKGFNYKPWATLIVVLIAVFICVVMYFRKNRNKKNYAVIGLITLVAVCLVWLIEIQSVEKHRDNGTEKKTNVVGEVTITIRCDTIVGNDDNEYIPESGAVIEFTEVLIEKGDTVYDVLSEVTANNNIHLETSGSAGGGSTIYIEGINHIYELDYGDLSGWMYFVNGEESSVGCSEYELEDGDKIEWLYSCEMGKDLK